MAIQDNSTKINVPVNRPKNISRTVMLIVSGIVATALIAGGVGYFAGNAIRSDNKSSNTISETTGIANTTSNIPNTSSPSIITSPSNSPILQTTTSIPTTTPIPVTFENDRMKLQVPDGWTSHTISTTNSGINYPNGGVVLLKGNYTLNIIPFSIGQASGVPGGRFGEIASYMISAPDLHIDLANCVLSSSSDTSMNSNLTRSDVYYTNVNNKRQVLKNLEI